MEEDQNEEVVRWFLSTHKDAELIFISIEDLCGVSQKEVERRDGEKNKEEKEIEEGKGKGKEKGNENEVEVNGKEGGKVDVEGEEKWNIRNKVNQNDLQILNPDANSNSDNHLDNNSANSLNIDDEINIDGSRTFDLDLQHALNLLTMDPTQLLTAVKERKYIL